MSGTANGTTAKLRPASATAVGAEQSVVWCSAVGSSPLTEISGAGFYSDALSFASFLRKGVACAVYADLAVTVANVTDVPRENRFANLLAPDPATITSPPTVNGNLTPTITVPNFGASVAITGTVKDAADNPLAGYTIRAASSALSDAVNLAGDSLEAVVTTDNSGVFILHVLPGTYTLLIAG
jgi:hypothetical protein